MRPIAIHRVALALAALLALAAAGCSGGGDPSNHACVTPAGSRLAWVYYPGYGCGPATPAGRGVFSG